MIARTRVISCAALLLACACGRQAPAQESPTPAASELPADLFRQRTLAQYNDLERRFEESVARQEQINRELRESIGGRIADMEREKEEFQERLTLYRAEELRKDLSRNYGYSERKPSPLEIIEVPHEGKKGKTPKQAAPEAPPAPREPSILGHEPIEVKATVLNSVFCPGWSMGPGSPVLFRVRASDFLPGYDPNRIPEQECMLLGRCEPDLTKSEQAHVHAEFLSCKRKKGGFRHTEIHGELTYLGGFGLPGRLYRNPGRESASIITLLKESLSGVDPAWDEIHKRVGSLTEKLIAYYNKNSEPVPGVEVKAEVEGTLVVGSEFDAAKAASFFTAKGRSRSTSPDRSAPHPTPKAENP